MRTLAVSEPTAPMERLLYEVKKVIVGQDHLLERLAVALLARGHLLVEGVPGLAKTMAIKTLAEAIGGEFKRIQFTPDLVPADLIGTRIYNQKTGEFNTSLRAGLHEPAARRRDQPRPGQGPERACSRSCRSARSRSVARPTRCPTRSSCWPPRTRSRPRAPTPCPRPRSTGSCSRCWSATRAPTRSSSSSSA